MADTVTEPIRSRRSAKVRDAEVTVQVFKRGTGTETADDQVKRAMFNSQALVDPFTGYYAASVASMSVMAPNWNPFALLRMPNECSALRQCIDAMVTNICSFGYRLEYIGPPDQEDSPAAKAEKDRIEGLTKQPNGEISFTEFRERYRRDLETFGYAFIEVGRRALDGEISYIGNVPAHTMRRTAKSPEWIKVEELFIRDGKTVKATVLKRFCRFVQHVGDRLVYFKEFGDPRLINPLDGSVGLAGSPNPLRFDQSANEIYHVQLYSPGDPYGVPRWISQLPSVMGLRESELTNLQFFKDNAIPALAVLVSGGALTNASLANIQNHFAVRGRQAANRVLVIEASGDEAAATLDSSVPAPKLEIKPLVSERQTDGHFADYEVACEKKIRSAFRIPPIFVGSADDYTRATADTSLVIADAQVFGPERNKEDEMFNVHFFTVDKQPLMYWALRTNPPRLVSPDQVLNALEELDNLGALTPNIAIGIANELFDMKLTKITQPWGDFPFSVVLALAKAGNLDGMQPIMIYEDAAITKGTETDGSNGNSNGTAKKPKAAPSKKNPKATNKPANSDKDTKEKPKAAKKDIGKDVEERIEAIAMGSLKRMNDVFVAARQRDRGPTITERTRTRD